MGAPNITFTTSKQKISSVSGFDGISVSFSADAAYQAFECRATKNEDVWGVGVGNLIASFSNTPENTNRTFEIYDDYLLSGDGLYRISLFVQGMDGSWNDTILFVPDGSTSMLTSDGDIFLCRKGDA